MDIMTYVLIAIIILVVIFAKMALVIIPQSETKIVERLGRRRSWSVSVVTMPRFSLVSTSSSRLSTVRSRLWC